MSEFLNWRTDPMLFDLEPKEQNQWLTANNLLESNRRDRFSTTGELLLYPVINCHSNYLFERITYILQK